jgi:HEAT repeat protein
MSRRTRRAVVVVLLGAATTVTVVLAVTHWQRFVEAWHLYRLESEDEEVRDEARRALVRLTSVRAVPVLAAREVVREESGAARTESRSSAGESAEPNPAVTKDRDGAREILKRLDTAGLEALVRLLHRGEPPVHLQTLILLEEANSPAASRAAFLRASLACPNEGVRRLAAEELSRLGSEARVAVPELHRARQDASEDVRLWAGIALRNLGEIETEELLAE